MVQSKLFALNAKPLDLDAQAERIYAEYPRHEGKGYALTKIRTAIKAVGFETLLEHVVEYAKACKAVQKPADKIPHPSTWFNQCRWEDDHKMWWNGAGDREAEQVFDRLVKFLKRYGRNYPDVTGPERPSWLKAMRIIRSIPGGWSAFCDGYSERTRRDWLERFKRAWREA